MSTIENQRVPQQKKPYKKYGQDHGDAAQARGIHPESYYLRKASIEGSVKKDAELLQAALTDQDPDYTSITTTQLEAVADQLLAEPVVDTIYTDIELGVTSRHQIRVQMARRATLDHNPDDDFGDDDYHVPVRIKTRLQTYY